ncbi:hypothetical protein BpHYR1_006918 [Brachionus plicatilis]|uniref:Uncharacterized protein n=1 Tax=Brachionus plicatilis TaxID=10195 RepID=A0A3M7QRQ2_BRAPC|nr:hypothetical protein BpHYR1_006918 [Brachionus plicatilis]
MSFLVNQYCYDTLNSPYLTVIILHFSGPAKKTIISNYQVLINGCQFLKFDIRKYVKQEKLISLAIFGIFWSLEVVGDWTLTNNQTTKKYQKKNNLNLVPESIFLWILVVVKNFSLNVNKKITHLVTASRAFQSPAVLFVKKLVRASQLRTNWRSIAR